jgi:hypothetical protein
MRLLSCLEDEQKIGAIQYPAPPYFAETAK